MGAGVSERQAARALGKALSTIQEARKRGDLIRSVTRDAGGRVRIDVEVAREELAEVAELKVTAAEGADETLQRWRAARARLAEAQATQAEDDLRKSRGELVEAAQVRSTWVDIITGVRNKLLGVHVKVRQRLPHLTLADVAVIEGEIREALEDLARSES